MTTLSRKQNSSRYHFNIACSIYLCYNNRDPILVNHPLFPFSFTVQFSITCKLSLFYRDNIMKFTTRNRLIWYTICENETFNFSNFYSILIETCGQKQTGLLLQWRELIAWTWTSSTPRKSHKTNRRTSLTDRYLPWTHYLQEARVCINGQIYT